MKRHLLCGTALAAATMLAAGGALAADKKMKPSISVNGYYEGVVGGILDETQELKVTYQSGDTTMSAKADMKADTSALDQRNDGEIHFNGRAATDNGMKFHMRAELEIQSDHQPGATDTDFIDEYFLSVSGSFGRIILGGTGGAPVKMLTGLTGSWATGVGETLNFDNAWVPGAHPGPWHYYLQHSRLDTGDADKMTYISPKLGGFQVGLTYSPNRVNNDRGGRYDTADGPHDGIEGAVSYTGKFGDVGFGVGAGMTAYQGADGKKDDDRSDWLVAGRIDFGGGFRVAVGHKRVTDDNKMMESQITDAGVRFVQGANSFSLVGSHGEMDNNDAQHTAVMGSYARALGPGVKWHANIIWNSSQSAKDSVTLEEETTVEGIAIPAGTYTAQAENSGTAVVTGLKVVF